jgi:hypothetical protein
MGNHAEESAYVVAKKKNAVFFETWAALDLACHACAAVRRWRSGAQVLRSAGTC